jgi:hypothetical protein
MTDNNFKIKASNGQTYPLNDLFHDSGASNTATEFQYWKNDDGSNYITGVNNKGTYLPGAATPDGASLINYPNNNGADSTGTSLGYLESEINNWNNKFGLDSCKFTEYKGPVPVGSPPPITANYLGAYYRDFITTTAAGPYGWNITKTYNTKTEVPGWCNHIIGVVVGGGGAGASNWTNNDSYYIGGAGGGGGYTIAKIHLPDHTAFIGIQIGQGGLSKSPRTLTNGEPGVSSWIKLLDSDQNEISGYEVTSFGGQGGQSESNHFDGGVGGGSSIDVDSDGLTKIGVQQGMTGQNGYHGDDNGGDWGEKVQTIGGESLVGCFKAVNTLTDGNEFNNHLYYTKKDSAYGRGGAGAGAGDDNNDSGDPQYHATDGGPGWVRLYLMHD